MPKFGPKSLKVRSTIHPWLEMLCDNVVKYFDISLISGRRGKYEQNDLCARGLSQLQWPDSNHNVDENSKFPDNLSKAVDVVPYPIPDGWGDLKSQDIAARDLAWKERVKFYQMAAIFKYEWAKMRDNYSGLCGYDLRFGIDWDSDNDFRDQTFDDLPHIELVEVSHGN